MRCMRVRTLHSTGEYMSQFVRLTRFGFVQKYTMSQMNVLACYVCRRRL